jgi:hypothetical protein
MNTGGDGIGAEICQFPECSASLHHFIQPIEIGNRVVGKTGAELGKDSGKICATRCRTKKGRNKKKFRREWKRTNLGRERKESYQE